MLCVCVGVAVAPALTGCTVGPNYNTPSAAVNDAWQEQGGHTDGVVGDWWETFNDPVLTALVRQAMDQNLTLRAAGLRVLEARAARGIAVGRFFPQVQEAFGGIDNNRLSENEPSASGDRSFATDRVGIQAAWELDFWGKFRRGIEAADAEVLASVADYDAVMVSLASDVAVNYILLRSLQEQLVYARQNADLQSETLKLTEARFKAGAVSELDVSTAKSTLANTLALIPELENGVQQSRLALGVLLGQPPSDLEWWLLPAVGRGETVPEAPARIAAGVPADLLRRRPDVRAAERVAAAQSARIGEAVADLYPQISITGSTAFISSNYENGRGSDLGDIFSANSFAGFIGLSARWPVLNYGRIEGNIRVRDARYEQAVAAYQETVLRAAADVESGLSEFLKARERSALLAQAVDASKRSTELSLIQYRAGAVDFIRVNIAQTDLVQQQTNLTAARATIALGAVRAYRALGGGWECHEGREFVDPETARRMRERTDWGDVLDASWETGTDLGFERSAPKAEAAPAPAPEGARHE